MDSFLGLCYLRAPRLTSPLFPVSTSFFKRLGDARNPRSLASKLRRRRQAFFLSLLARIPRTGQGPLRLLDVGGNHLYWTTVGIPSAKEVEITVLNLDEAPRPDLRIVRGDARHMPEFTDGYFDIVFSNSVIEHVGNFKDQQAMAREVARVGKRYFVQTPNRYFPIEPHFFFPGFQFLPLAVRAWLVGHFDLGFSTRTRDPRVARERVESIQLLSHASMRRLFPEAEIFCERFAGLTKSFVAYGGWETPDEQGRSDKQGPERQSSQ